MTGPGADSSKIDQLPIDRAAATGEKEKPDTDHIDAFHDDFFPRKGIGEGTLFAQAGSKKKPSAVPDAAELAAGNADVTAKFKAIGTGTAAEAKDNISNFQSTAESFAQKLVTARKLSQGDLNTAKAKVENRFGMADSTAKALLLLDIVAKKMDDKSLAKGLFTNDMKNSLDVYHLVGNENDKAYQLEYGEKFGGRTLTPEEKIERDAAIVRACGRMFGGYEKQPWSADPAERQRAWDKIAEDNKAFYSSDRFFREPTGVRVFYERFMDAYKAQEEKKAADAEARKAGTAHTSSKTATKRAGGLVVKSTGDTLTGVRAKTKGGAGGKEVDFEALLSPGAKEVRELLKAGEIATVLDPKTEWKKVDDLLSVNPELKDYDNWENFWDPANRVKALRVAASLQIDPDNLHKLLNKWKGVADEPAPTGPQQKSSGPSFGTVLHGIFNPFDYPTPTSSSWPWWAAHGVGDVVKGAVELYIGKDVIDSFRKGGPANGFLRNMYPDFIANRFQKELERRCGEEGIDISTPKLRRDNCERVEEDVLEPMLEEWEHVLDANLLGTGPKAEKIIKDRFRSKFGDPERRPTDDLVKKARAEVVVDPLYNKTFGAEANTWAYTLGKLTVDEYYDRIVEAEKNYLATGEANKSGKQAFIEYKNRYATIISDGYGQVPAAPYIYEDKHERRIRSKPGAIDEAVESAAKLVTQKSDFKSKENDRAALVKIIGNVRDEVLNKGLKQFDGKAATMLKVLTLADACAELANRLPADKGPSDLKHFVREASIGKTPGLEPTRSQIGAQEEKHKGAIFDQVKDGTIKKDGSPITLGITNEEFYNHGIKGKDGYRASYESNKNKITPAGNKGLDAIEAVWADRAAKNPKGLAALHIFGDRGISVDPEAEIKPAKKAVADEITDDGGITKWTTKDARETKLDEVRDATLKRELGKYDTDTVRTSLAFVEACKRLKTETESMDPLKAWQRCRDIADGKPLDVPPTSKEIRDAKKVATDSIFNKAKDTTGEGVRLGVTNKQFNDLVQNALEDHLAGNDGNELTPLSREQFQKIADACQTLADNHPNEPAIDRLLSLAGKSDLLPNENDKEAQKAVAYEKLYEDVRCTQGTAKAGPNGLTQAVQEIKEKAQNTLLGALVDASPTKITEALALVEGCKRASTEITNMQGTPAEVHRAIQEKAGIIQANNVDSKEVASRREAIVAELRSKWTGTTKASDVVNRLDQMRRDQSDPKKKADYVAIDAIESLKKDFGRTELVNLLAREAVKQISVTTVEPVKDGTTPKEAERNNCDRLLKEMAVAPNTWDSYDRILEDLITRADDYELSQLEVKDLESRRKKIETFVTSEKDAQLPSRARQAAGAGPNRNNAPTSQKPRQLLQNEWTVKHGGTLSAEGIARAAEPAKTGDENQSTGTGGADNAATANEPVNEPIPLVGEPAVPRADVNAGAPRVADPLNALIASISSVAEHDRVSVAPSLATANLIQGAIDYIDANRADLAAENGGEINEEVIIEQLLHQKKDLAAKIERSNDPKLTPDVKAAMLGALTAQLRQTALPEAVQAISDAIADTNRGGVQTHIDPRTIDLDSQPERPLFRSSTSAAAERPALTVAVAENGKIVLSRDGKAIEHNLPDVVKMCEAGVELLREAHKKDPNNKDLKDQLDHAEAEFVKLADPSHQDHQATMDRVRSSEHMQTAIRLVQQETERQSVRTTERGERADRPEAEGGRGQMSRGAVLSMFAREGLRSKAAEALLRALIGVAK